MKNKDQVLTPLWEQLRKAGHMSSVVVGGFGVELNPAAVDPEPKRRRYNSAFAYSPGQAEPSRYDKSHLVLFGEYVPFRGGRLHGLLRDLRLSRLGRREAQPRHEMIHQRDPQHQSPDRVQPSLALERREQAAHRPEEGVVAEVGESARAPSGVQQRGLVEGDARESERLERAPGAVRGGQGPRPIRSPGRRTRHG